MFLPGDWSFPLFINLCSNKTKPCFGVDAESKGGAVLLLGYGQFGLLLHTLCTGILGRF